MPGFGVGLHNTHRPFPIRIIKSDIGSVKEIICEPLFDILLLISGADYEVIEPIVRVFLHDVPEDRPATNFNHRFRLKL
jgi:hypothetical protein